MRNSGRIFWGFVLILAALLILGAQFNAFSSFSVISLLAIVLLAALFVTNLVKLEFVVPCLSLSVIYLILYQSDALALPRISMWPLLGAAALVGVGLDTLFQNARRSRKAHWKSAHCGFEGNSEYDGNRHTKLQDNQDDNHPSCSVTFGTITKYLHSSALETGSFSCSFGELAIYFDEATLSENGANIDVSANFCEVSLFIPKEWQVNENIHPTLAEVRHHGPQPAFEPTAPKLYISGNVNFADVKIHRI